MMDEGHPDPEALREEEDRIQKLRLVVDRTASLLMHGRYTLDEVSEIIRQTRSRVLELFPDRGELFDLIYAPRFLRLFREWERWREGNTNVPA